MRLFLGPGLPPEATVGPGAENEWNWRIGVEKIRGERQKGCPKVRLGKKHRGLTRGEFPNTAERQARRPHLVALKFYN